MKIVLPAALVLVLYGIYREQVDQQAREWFASKTIDPDEEDPSSIRANLEAVQLTPAPAGEDAAAAPRKFLLSARYVDQDQNVVGTPAMEWKFDPLAEGAASPSGEITVTTFPATGSAPAKAIASSGGTNATVQVMRWAGPQAAAAAADVVVFKETPPGVARPPSVVLVEEASDLKCSWGRPWAFVGAAAVGEQARNPCSLTLLSADRAMLFQDNDAGTQWPPDKWAANGTRISLDAATPLKLDVTVFLAVTPGAAAQENTEQAASEPAGSPPPDPAAMARNDIDIANMLYEANRVGLTLNLKQVVPLPPAPNLQALVGADPYDCVRAVKLPGNPTGPDFGYDSSAVSIYYVDRINYPPDPAYPRIRGIQCHYWYSGNPKVGIAAAVGHPELGKPPGSGPVVYISYGHHSSTTLAHELGHVLGLNDEEGALGPVDLMHNLLPDGRLGADARSQLRVGQVFRMNVWNDSWINTRLPKPPLRACDAGSPCPPVDLDAR